MKRSKRPLETETSRKPSTKGRSTPHGRELTIEEFDRHLGQELVETLNRNVRNRVPTN